MEDEQAFVLQRPAQGGFGFSITRQIISRVTPNGAADKAGLSSGDEIVTINGEDARTMSHMMLTNKIKTSGQSLSLVIRGKSAPQGQAIASSQAPPSQPQVTSIKTDLPSLSQGVKSPLGSPLPAPRKTPQRPQPVDLSSEPPSPKQVVQDETVTNPQQKVEPQVPKPAVPNQQAVPSSVAPTEKPEPVKEADKHPAPVEKPPAVPSPTKSPKSKLEQSLASALQNKVKNAEKKGDDADEAIIQARAALASQTLEPKSTVIADGEVCQACQKPIVELFVKAAGDVIYHPDCFVCSSCSTSLVDLAHTFEDGKPMCQQCWAQANGLVCFSCKQPIQPDEDGRAQYTESAGNIFHKTCFKCQVCGSVFSDKVPGPYKVNEMYLCRQHAMEEKRKQQPGGAKPLGKSQDPESQAKLNNIVQASKSGWR